MDFFCHCATHNDAKALFRKLAKQFHPDKGGDLELMTEMKRQYETFQPNKSFKTYQNFNSYKKDQIINAYQQYIPVLERAVRNKNDEIDRLKDKIELLQYKIDAVKSMTIFQKLVYIFFSW